MNREQKIVLVVGLFLMALVGLFPPWTSNVDVLDDNDVKPAYYEPGGRRFLFLPPKPMMAEKRLIITQDIDYSRLVVEWTVMGLLTVSALGVFQILKEQAPQGVSQQPARAA